MSLFRPARQSKETELFADLDALIAEPIAFRLHGRVHEIKPITTREFYLLANRLSALFEMRNQEKITPTELIDAYYALVSSVCDSVTKKDLEDMSQAQVGALFQLIIETMTGRAHVPGGEKKKIPPRTQSDALS